MAVVRLPVVTGPTGAGKSALALAFAATRPVTIVSADSRQVYRGFDIGTAKPTAAERLAVPHEALDVADPAERFGAARWAEAATDAIERARAAGRVPLLVGGTGLYLRALFEPLFEEPPLDPAARAALEGELAAWDTARLREAVVRVDPARAHLGRTQLLRALEIHRLTGTSISEWHARAGREARYAPRTLVVERGAALHARLGARIDAMLAAGWVREVEGLMAIVPDAAPAWNATGYDALRQVVRGTLDLAQARSRVLIATRQYAKRQRTWFRHQLDAATVTTVTLGEPGATELAWSWWNALEAP